MKTKNLTPDNISIRSKRSKVYVDPDTEHFGDVLAGWAIGSDEMSKGSVKIQATNERILLGVATEPLTGVGIFIGKDGTDYEFRVGDPDNKYLHYDGTDVDLVGSISGRSTAIIAGAINSIGHFIDANLDTSAKTILGDFTFGESGAIKMITDENNGLWISPTGILGKKAGDTTFAIDILGNATFSGTLVAAAGTLGEITIGTNAWHVDSLGNMWWGNFANYADATYKISTAGVGNLSGIVAASVAAENITGTTITGKTLQTSESNARVVIDGDTDSINIYDASYLRALLDGSGINLYNTSGNKSASMTADASGVLIIDVSSFGGSGGAMNITGSMNVTGHIAAGDVVPKTNNTYYLGSPSYEWKKLYVGEIELNGVSRTTWSSGSAFSCSDLSSCSITSMGTTSGDFSMNSHKITSLATPTLTYDAATKKYVDDNAGSFSCSDLSGCNLDDLGTTDADFSMNSHKITSLATPINDSDAATRNYVDTVADSISSFGSTITPTTNDAYNLGSSSYNWQNLYLENGADTGIYSDSTILLETYTSSGGVIYSKHFKAHSGNTYDLGDDTYYWRTLYYGTSVKKGGFGFFDKGVELQNGKIVSDLESLMQMKENSKLTTPYGSTIIDYKSLPKVVFRKARDSFDKELPRDENGAYQILTPEDKGGPKEGTKKIKVEDGEDVNAMISILIGAVRELGVEVNKLKKTINVVNK